MCPPMCHLLTDGKYFPQPLDNGKCGANSCEVHLFLRPTRKFSETFAGCTFALLGLRRLSGEWSY